MARNDAVLRDRFRGALLGTLVGDALGAPVEEMPCDRLNEALDSFSGMSREERQRQVPVFGLLAGAEVPPGYVHYTDDTQMTIGVAESLIAYPEFDGSYLASRFAENFEGHRGYGPGGYAMIQELRNGAAWNEVGEQLFGGEGSFGNGAAMRAAPVGMLYHDDLPALRRIAEAQASVTHTHPIGRQSAALQAAAVAAALRFDIENEDFDGLAFIDSVTDSTVVGPLENWLGAGYHDVRTLLRVAPRIEEVAETLGNGIEAQLSVPTALYAFAAHYDSFAQAVLYAVRLGGDADTIGAMTGAIAGAFHGASAIPPNWLAALENGPQGRDYIASLGDQLFDRWRQRASENGKGQG
ncbi:MAG: ADP-ribosylglycohydrolase family protein [Cytophagales bacterium]|nr:ADP-ribosylglycohydrolase family protein [Armatimonadota bacterium]